MDLRSKMEKNEILLSDPLVVKHIPETLWYSQENLGKMLQKYGTVYLKPNRGKQGENIIRVRKTTGSRIEISCEKDKKDVESKELNSELHLLIKDKQSYIVQQGIDLATYNGNPFDMRVVLQKPQNAWLVTLTSAKVADSSDAVVTNVSRGAKDYLLHNILDAYDQKRNPIVTMREIIDLSHRIANIIGSKMPITITGLDLAVDRHGKIWFIEANTNPACKQCKLVNDKVSVQKFEKAKKIISSAQKKTKNSDKKVFKKKYLNRKQRKT